MWSVVWEGAVIWREGRDTAQPFVWEAASRCVGEAGSELYEAGLAVCVLEVLLLGKLGAHSDLYGSWQSFVWGAGSRLYGSAPGAGRRVQSFV